MKMKKIISAVMLLAAVLALASCGNGRSIPIEVVKRANMTGTLLSNGSKSYTEEVTYFDGDEHISYKLYFEEAENATAYSYNIVEEIGDYKLVAHEGDIFKIKGDKICAVLFANQALSYYQYIKDYANDSLDVKFPLDLGERYQLESKSDEDFITVSYYADVTPQIASAVYSTTLKTGDKIISEYKLDRDYRIWSINYTVKHADGSENLVARRTFLHYTDKSDNVFSSLPDGDDVAITLVIGEREYEYFVPDGVYIEFEDGGVGYEYFTDAEFTQKYVTAKAEEMTVYVKTNFD